MKQKSEVLRHIPELDGVRGTAVLVVMVMHFYDPVQDKSPFGPLTHLIGQGGAGVDLFFVLSGFLITSILVSTKSALNYFRSFYARRAVRIFPLYVVVVALFFFLVLPVLHRHGKDRTMHFSEQIWYWLFLENWQHAFQHNDGAQLAHFWSLAIEEQFYFVWSVLVFFMQPRRIAQLSALLIAAVLLGRTIAALLGVDSVFLYFSTLSRLDTLAFGALLATSAQTREFFRRFGFYILPVAFLLCCASLPMAASFAVYSIGSAALVGVAVTRSIPVLRMGWLRRFGKYSYGLYVLHYLIHGALAPIAARYNPLAFALLAIPGGILLSYAAASVSWRLLETPFLRLKRRVAYIFPQDQPN